MAQDVPSTASYRDRPGLSSKRGKTVFSPAEQKASDPLLRGWMGTVEGMPLSKAPRHEQPPEESLLMDLQPGQRLGQPLGIACDAGGLLVRGELTGP